MTTTSFIAANLVLLGWCSTALSQSKPWSPIPFGQTSYFKSEHTGEIIPMKCDAQSLDSIQYEIYFETMLNEFDTCANDVWHPEWGIKPRCDFKRYWNHGEEYAVVIQGKEDDFSVRFDTTVGSLYLFSLDLPFLIRVEAPTTQLIFDVEDSIRPYTIVASDGITEIGELHLSKSFGLVKYTPFQVLENYNGSATDTWTLVGYSNDTLQMGVSLPLRNEYLPYHAGDSLFFQWQYWRSLGSIPPYFELVNEYQFLRIDDLVVDSTKAQLRGICHVYNDGKALINIDSNYTIDMYLILRHSLSRGESVPYTTDVMSHTMIAYPEYNTSIDSGMVLRTRAFDFINCFAPIDGLCHYESYSDTFGLLEQTFCGYAAPSSKRTLIAARGPQIEFGDWPTNLGIENYLDSYEVQIYPNPASYLLEVSLSPGEPFLIDMFSMQGQRVYSATAENNVSIDVSQIPGGVYILTYTNGNNSGHESVVIQH